VVPLALVLVAVWGIAGPAGAAAAPSDRSGGQAEPAAGSGKPEPLKLDLELRADTDAEGVMRIVAESGERVAVGTLEHAEAGTSVVGFGFETRRVVVGAISRKGLYRLLEGPLGYAADSQVFDERSGMRLERGLDGSGELGCSIRTASRDWGVLAALERRQSSRHWVSLHGGVHAARWVEVHGLAGASRIPGADTPEQWFVEGPRRREQTLVHAGVLVRLRGSRESDGPVGAETASRGAGQRQAQYLLDCYLFGSAGYGVYPGSAGVVRLQRHGRRADVGLLAAFRTRSYRGIDGHSEPCGLSAALSGATHTGEDLAASLDVWWEHRNDLSFRDRKELWPEGNGPCLGLDPSLCLQEIGGKLRLGWRGFRTLYPRVSGEFTLERPEAGAALAVEGRLEPELCLEGRSGAFSAAVPVRFEKRSLGGPKGQGAAAAPGGVTTGLEVGADGEFGVLRVELGTTAYELGPRWTEEGTWSATAGLGLELGTVELEAQCEIAEGTAAGKLSFHERVLGELRLHVELATKPEGD
jgi:hypothetical protein